LDSGEHIHTSNGAPGDALLAEAAMLRAHPAYAAALAAYTAGLVRFRQSSRLINKLSAHEVRFRVVGYLLHLSAVSRDEARDGGVPYGRLHELAVASGEVSPRVLKTMLALMRLAGFVDSWRDAGDRRVTVYRPTDRMLGFARQWFLHAAQALDRVDPSACREARLAGDAAFLNRLLVTAGRDHADGPPAGRMPEFIAFFGGREGANAVVARLLLAESGPATVSSRAALAREFWLSRTQVSDVIAEGVRIGYLDLDRRSLPTATDRLREQFARWVSIELAFYARHMR
jgi:hypothetical protein